MQREGKRRCSKESSTFGQSAKRAMYIAAVRLRAGVLLCAQFDCVHRLLCFNEAAAMTLRNATSGSRISNAIHRGQGFGPARPTGTKQAH